MACISVYLYPSQILVAIAGRKAFTCFSLLYGKVISIRKFLKIEYLKENIL